MSKTEQEQKTVKKFYSSTPDANKSESVTTVKIHTANFSKERTADLVQECNSLLRANTAHKAKEHAGNIVWNFSEHEHDGKYVINAEMLAKEELPRLAAQVNAMQIGSYLESDLTATTEVKDTLKPSSTDTRSKEFTHFQVSAQNEKNIVIIAKDLETHKTLKEEQEKAEEKMVKDCTKDEYVPLGPLLASLKSLTSTKDKKELGAALLSKSIPVAVDSKLLGSATGLQLVKDGAILTDYRQGGGFAITAPTISLDDAKEYFNIEGDDVVLTFKPLHTKDFETSTFSAEIGERTIDDFQKTIEDNGFVITAKHKPSTDNTSFKQTFEKATKYSANKPALINLKSLPRMIKISAIDDKDLKAEAEKLVSDNTSVKYTLPLAFSSSTAVDDNHNVDIQNTLDQLSANVRKKHLVAVKSSESSESFNKPYLHIAKKIAKIKTDEAGNDKVKYANIAVINSNPEEKFIQGPKTYKLLTVKTTKQTPESYKEDRSIEKRETLELVMTNDKKEAHSMFVENMDLLIGCGKLKLLEMPNNPKSSMQLAEKTNLIKTSADRMVQFDIKQNNTLSNITVDKSVSEGCKEIFGTLPTLSVLDEEKFTFKIDGSGDVFTKIQETKERDPMDTFVRCVDFAYVVTTLGFIEESMIRAVKDKALDDSVKKQLVTTIDEQIKTIPLNHQNGRLTLTLKVPNVAGLDMHQVLAELQTSLSKPGHPISILTESSVADDKENSITFSISRAKDSQLKLRNPPLKSLHSLVTSYREGTMDPSSSASKIPTLAEKRAEIYTPSVFTIADMKKAVQSELEKSQDQPVQKDNKVAQENKESVQKDNKAEQGDKKPVSTQEDRKVEYSAKQKALKSVLETGEKKTNLTTSEAVKDTTSEAILALGGKGIELVVKSADKDDKEAKNKDNKEAKDKEAKDKDKETLADDVQSVFSILATIAQEGKNAKLGMFHKLLAMLQQASVAVKQFFRLLIDFIRSPKGEDLLKRIIDDKNCTLAEVKTEFTEYMKEQRKEDNAILKNITDQEFQEIIDATNTFFANNEQVVFNIMQVISEASKDKLTMDALNDAFSNRIVIMKDGKEISYKELVTTSAPETTPTTPVQETTSTTPVEKLPTAGTKLNQVSVGNAVAATPEVVVSA